MKLKHIALSLVLIGLGIAGALVYQNNQETASGNEGKESASVDSSSPLKVKIIDGLSANSLHVHLADKLGFFAEEGLSAEVSYTSIGKLAMDALNAGGVDFAGVVEMNVAHTLFNHDDIAILCEYSEPVNGIKVLGRKSKGVEKSVDLRGKRIGVFFGVNIHIFIVKLLEENGIGLEEVELVNLKPPDAVAAFISGDIDAVITWQPHDFNIRKRIGDDVALLTDDALRYWPYKLLLVTKRSYLENHHEEAIRVLRALLKADRFIAEEPERTYEMIADHLKLDPANVRQFCEEIHYEIRLTPRLTEMIEYEVNWLPRHLPAFFTGKEPVTTDYSSLVTDTLETVKTNTTSTK